MTQIQEKILSKKKIFDQLFNIKSPDYVKNPYKYYAEVRENCPIYKTPYGVYVLTRYNDIQTVLTSKKLTKNYWGSLENIYGMSCHQESGFSLISQWMTNLNPPKHTQIRKLLITALSSKSIPYLQEVTHSIAEQLIDKFYDQGSTNLMKSYSFKLPALVICRLLGIPDSDFEFVFEHVHIPNRLLDPVYHSRTVLDDANQSVDQLKSYFANLCFERKKKLGDDLISQLLIARREEKLELSDEELISNIFFLFGAGYETTMNLITNSLYVIYSHPSELARLVADWSLLPQMLEEILRFESPVQVASPSLAIEDIEIDEFIIPKGEVIIPILGSANRDPDIYVEPDSFIFDRDPKILSFGSGIHLCLGSQLARIEVKIAIECLIKRIPNLHIENIADPRWKPHVGVRGLAELIGNW